MRAVFLKPGFKRDFVETPWPSVDGTAAMLPESSFTVAYERSVELPDSLPVGRIEKVWCELRKIRNVQLRKPECPVFVQVWLLEAQEDR